MRAFIFPGQGSQAVGMGKTLAEGVGACARGISGGRRGARPASFQADERRAGRSAHADRKRPARDHGERDRHAARARTGRRRDAVGQGPYVAGHSLGEYSALCAAGAFDLATTARLLKTRGQACRRRSPSGVGAMAALLGADIDTAQARRRGRGRGLHRRQRQ